MKATPSLILLLFISINSYGQVTSEATLGDPGRNTPNTGGGGGGGGGSSVPGAAGGGSGAASGGGAGSGTAGERTSSASQIPGKDFVSPSIIDFVREVIDINGGNDGSRTSAQRNAILSQMELEKAKASASGRPKDVAYITAQISSIQAEENVKINPVVQPSAQPQKDKPKEKKDREILI